MTSPLFKRRVLVPLVFLSCVWQLAWCQGSDAPFKVRPYHKTVLKSGKSIKKLIAHLLASDTTDYEEEFRYIVDAISIPRSVNTKGHRHVRKFIKSTIRSLSTNWHVEEDNFSTDTPVGPARFRNIVATFVPGSRLCGATNQTQPRIVLSCHYDSLNPSLVHEKQSSHRKKRHKFVGATDAAVSCSIVLSLAHFMTPYLKLLSKQGEPSTPTLQLVFFDGEEALLNGQLAGKKSLAHKAGLVKGSNSLYGSRHLAQKWENTARRNVSSSRRPGRPKSRRLRRAPNAAQRLASASEQLCRRYQSSVGREDEVIDAVGAAQLNDRLHQNYHTLDNIKLFLLLDLIGGSSPSFYNTNLQTTKYFRRLAEIEKHLLAQTTDPRGGKVKSFFQTSPSFVLSLVRDDHLPFVVRNVPVVHLIPSPFPRNWHTTDDDLEKISFEAIQRILMVLQIFLLDSFR